MTLENEDVNNLLDMAKHESHLLQSGEKFVLRDLFKGYQWDRISDTNKKDVSKKFWAYVHHESEHIHAHDEEKQEYLKK